MDEEKTTETQLYFSGDRYFKDVLKFIQAAEWEIRIEIYMFNLDHLGLRILESLRQKQLQGIRIFLLVDGIGSVGHIRFLKKFCLKHEINFNVYNPLFFSLFLKKFNFRDHRKLFMIDRKTIFLGSFNISDDHLTEFKKEKSWRDTGISINNSHQVETIIKSHLEAWENAKNHFPYLSAKSFHKKIKRALQKRKNHLENFYQLLQSIKNAQERILITTAYFVPHRKIILALLEAAERQVKVCLCLPGFSDIWFMRWIARLLYRPLLNAGVVIYEYQKSILHAKSLIIDHWGAIGSFNLNHRSLLQDLEVQIIITDPQLVSVMDQQWKTDILYSQQIMPQNLEDHRFFYRVIAGIFYKFRYWL